MTFVRVVEVVTFVRVVEVVTFVRVVEVVRVVERGTEEGWSRLWIAQTVIGEILNSGLILSYNLPHSDDDLKPYDMSDDPVSNVPRPPQYLRTLIQGSYHAHLSTSAHSYKVACATPTSVPPHTHTR